MPYFTNSVYNLEPGEPFEITWAGARGAVNITLRNGPVDDLRPVAVIDSECKTPYASTKTPAFADYKFQSQRLPKLFHMGAAL